MATLNKQIKQAQTHLANGQLKEANHLYQTVLKANPEHSDALHYLGIISYKEGRYDDAIEQINNGVKSALKKRKLETLTEGYYFLGLSHHEKGHFDKALEYFNKTLLNNSNHANAYAMMARTYNAMGELKKAIPLYEKSCALNPHSTIAWNNLANNYHSNAQYDEAQQAYEKVLQLDPSLTSAYQPLGSIYALKGEYQKAMAMFQKAFSASPSAGLCIEMSTVLPYLYQSENELEQYRNQYTQNLMALLQSDLKFSDPLKELQAPVNFFLAYQAKNDRDIQEGLGQLFSNAIIPRPYTPHPPHNKIRVGFISRLFSNTHTIGHLTGGLIKHLPKDQFDVSVFHIDTQSKTLSSEIHMEGIKHIRLPNRDLILSTEIIADKEMDILFYSDIGMDLTTYFLSLNRLAEVQCCTWGHPVTTGVPNIDYFISSQLIEPENAEAHYTEELILFNKLPCYYELPEIEKNKLPKSAFGFSESDHLYICPQSLQKLNPALDALFGEILRKDPDGKIVLIREKSDMFNEQLKNRFAHTIPDVLERIVFIDRMEQHVFLGFLSCADVMLDPIGFGGGNTNYQAFAFGTPVVTLPGEFMRGRVTLGCYAQMGVMDCVVSSPEAYVDQAVRLGTDHEYRQEISQKIMQANHRIYEDHEAIDELSHFFSTVLEKARTQR